ncbi:unnamed protein product, partial [Prorocentrum cordatum]
SSAARAFVGLAGPPCADRWGAAGRCAGYELRGLCHDGVAVAGLEANATEGCCACGRGGLREGCPGAASEARTLWAACLPQGAQPLARHARLPHGRAAAAGALRLRRASVRGDGGCWRQAPGARLPAREAFRAAEALLADSTSGARPDGLVEGLLPARHAADVAIAGMLGRCFGGPGPGALATARVVADGSAHVGVFTGQTSRHLLEGLPLLRLHCVGPYAAEDEHPEANGDVHKGCQNLSQSAASYIGGPLDMVFLDGSHCSEAVWGDLLSWAPYTRRIAGHDMNMASWGVAHAVIRWSAGRAVHLSADGVWYVDV